MKQARPTKTFSDQTPLPDTLLAKKKRHLNREFSPFDRLLSLPQNEAPSYFPPEQREKIRNFLSKSTLQLGNTYHEAPPRTPEADHSTQIRAEFSIREERRQQQRKQVHNDSVVLGLERNQTNPNERQSVKLLHNLEESAKLATHLRDELRKHSFKFGDWNGNRLNRSCDTTANQTSLALMRNLQIQGPDRVEEAARQSKAKLQKSHVPLPLSSDPASEMLDLHKKDRYQTQNTGQFKEVKDMSPGESALGVYKVNRAKQLKSRVILGHVSSENISPTHYRPSSRLQQSQVKMPRKSLEIQRIYREPPARRFNVGNVNKRSVITEQWISDRRSSQQPDTTVLSSFYSKHASIPRHVRERDRMVASVMKKSSLVLRDTPVPQERYHTHKIVQTSQSQEGRVETGVLQSETYLRTIDQEYLHRSNAQRLQGQKNNRNFDQNIDLGREAREQQSLYRKTFHASHSSAVLANVKENAASGKEYGRREQASQFRLGLRDAGMASEKQLQFRPIEGTPIIADRSHQELVKNYHRNQEDHLPIKKGALDGSPLFKQEKVHGVSDTFGEAGKKYKEMMASTSEKIIGGGAAAARKSKMRVAQIGRVAASQAKSNFEEAKRIRELAQKSQFELSASKKADYATSYGSLYGWKAPRPFV